MAGRWHLTCGPGDWSPPGLPCAVLGLWPTQIRFFGPYLTGLSGPESPAVTAQLVCQISACLSTHSELLSSP